MSAPFFYVRLKKNKMTDFGDRGEREKDQKKPEIPYRMSRIAFPKAKYGIYLAIIIIIIVLLISYKDLIF